MCYVMRHHGPDDGGTFKDLEFDLWHQWLSIIGLEGEHLPVNTEWRNIP